MSSVLWVVVPIAVVAFMYWLSFRIEPHWVSKDGQRFICSVQPITRRGEPEGRQKETRVAILSNGDLHISQRRVLRKSLNEEWYIAGKSPSPPKRRAVYVLNAVGDDGTAGQLALKLPDSSKAVPILDEVLERRSPKGS